MSFSFGKNWESFSRKALNNERIHEARSDFEKLFNNIDIRGRTFLDIGFGQGLSLYIAQELGAQALGIDIDPDCEKALELTSNFFPSVKNPVWKIASILDADFVNDLVADGGFDIVHSWGVLHHTGNMGLAIQNAARLVKPGGNLVMAIYNRHWTSRLWWFVKRIYNALPRMGQSVILGVIAPFMYLRILWLKVFQRSDSNRGMEFIHNVRDWLGGFPYEYASPDEIKEILFEYGFELQTFFPTAGWTGCNEFVFKPNIRDNEKYYGCIAKAKPI